MAVSSFAKVAASETRMGIVAVVIFNASMFQYFAIACSRKCFGAQTWPSVHGRSLFPFCSLEGLNNKERGWNGFWCSPWRFSWRGTSKYTPTLLFIIMQKCEISIICLKHMWIAWFQKILGGKRREFESRHLHFHFCNIKISFSHKCSILKQTKKKSSSLTFY